MIKIIKEIIGKLTKPEVTYICDRTGDIFVEGFCLISLKYDPSLALYRYSYQRIKKNRIGAWEPEGFYRRMNTPLRKEKR